MEHSKLNTDHNHQSESDSLKQRRRLSRKTDENNGKDENLEDENQEFNNGSSRFLGFSCSLMIKAIGFQSKLFFKFVSFPFSVLYKCCMFYVDPFGAVRRLLGKLFGTCIKNVCLYVIVFFKQKKLFWMIGYGLFWWCYVCVGLSCLFVSSLVFSGFVMRHCVEEPIYVKEVLNFDYTKGNPVTYVPIGSCGGCGENSGVSCEENGEYGNGVRFSEGIMPNRKVLVTVSLTLPESYRNRNLGTFQVRADFLSFNGRRLASYSHPCMLQFKSEPIRLLSTFAKIAPLVAGYATESQTRKVKIRGFIEGDYYTSCLRVLIEQKPEFLPNAGFPDIYDASLIVESELTLFKRIMWYWKKTVYVWISVTIFILELLLFLLVCCRPKIKRRTKTNNDS